MIRTTVIGSEALTRVLMDADPSLNPEIASRGLRRVTLLTAKIAAEQKMKRGGKNPPSPGILTSRTGTGRRSISTDFGELPRAATVGSHLTYMAVHEEGGSVSVPAQTVRSHTRTVAFGRTVAPFTVPSHTRSAHTARNPARPWLGPAVDDVVPKAPGIFVEEWERAIP